MENTTSEGMRSLPPGFRFHATDEELLIDYLKPKILGQPGDHYYDMIPEIDRKYLNSKRSDRTTEAGYWKVTGKERTIMSEDTNVPIGIKKTLVFYEGRVPKGKRTNWVSHEYHLNPKCLSRYLKEDEMLPYAACRIKNKKEKKLMMGHAPTISPEDYSISPHTSTGNVSETPVNQEGDYPSFCNTPNDQLADNQEAAEAQPETSWEEFMESLPPLEPLDDTLSDYNTATTYQPQAVAEEASLSLLDFSYDNNRNEFDNGYMASP